MKGLTDSILHIYPDSDMWIEGVAKFIYQEALVSQSKGDRFKMSLAGGSTPRKIYQRLAQPPYDQFFPWSDTLLFWGDERAVPHEHQDSNYRMVKEALLDYVNIPEDQIHFMKSPEDPHQSAAHYHQLLEDHTLDLTLLGLGTDGHTASLFPNTDVLNSKKRAQEIYVPKLDAFRISMTSQMINSSGTIVFLVTGEQKASIIRDILLGDSESDAYPAQLIRPVSGSLHWMLDFHAARYLIDGQ